MTPTISALITSPGEYTVTLVFPLESGPEYIAKGPAADERVTVLALELLLAIYAKRGGSRAAFLAVCDDLGVVCKL